eukprot:TRINITY_DN329_c1_g2_i1.p1 TRINITY_DN329_c1_g2~~TRINITY_DN329_c1_g2_i1.p1  ORF type:complete len:224 (+),score=74.05 TRINITY_DN329_c1_g2_i1:52-723(+)
MTILCWILSVLGVVLCGLSFLYYMGYFFKPKAKREEYGPAVMFYKEHRGSYYKVGDTFSSLSKLMETHKFTVKDVMGIYFDEPNTVKESELRAYAGLVFETNVSTTIVDICEKAGLKRLNIPKFTCMSARFPYRNVLSYALGPMVVYKALAKQYLDEKWPNCGSIELCRTDTEKALVYIFPLDHTDVFIHPEGVRPSLSSSASSSSSSSSVSTSTTMETKKQA